MFRSMIIAALFVTSLGMKENGTEGLPPCPPKFKHFDREFIIRMGYNPDRDAEEGNKPGINRERSNSYPKETWNEVTAQVQKTTSDATERLERGKYTPVGPKKVGEVDRYSWAGDRVVEILDRAGEYTLRFKGSVWHHNLRSEQGEFVFSHGAYSKRTLGKHSNLLKVGGSFRLYVCEEATEDNRRTRSKKRAGEKFVRPTKLSAEETKFLDGLFAKLQADGSNVPQIAEATNEVTKVLIF